MAIERVDYSSQDEYEQALQAEAGQDMERGWQNEEEKEEMAQAEWEAEQNQQHE